MKKLSVACTAVLLLVLAGCVTPAAGGSIDSRDVTIANGSRQALLAVGKGGSPYKAAGFLAPAFFTTATSGDSVVPGMSNGKIAEVQQYLEEAKTNGFFSMEWFGSILTVSPAYYEGDLDSISVFDNFTASSINIPSIVVYGENDVTVPHSVCKNLINIIKAKEVKIPNADHGYGFYSDQKDVSAAVEGAFVDFFSKEL